METKIEPGKENLIRKLIEQGIGIDIIALELEVPIQDVRDIKLDIEKVRARRFSQKDTKGSHLKMQLLRDRYRRKLFGSDERENKSEGNESNKELSNEDLQELRKKIDALDQKIQESANLLTNKEARGSVCKIMKDVKSLQESYPQLPLEEAERLNNLINSSQMKDIMMRLRKDGDVNRALISTKKNIIKSLAESISREQGRTEDIQELESLCRKITPEMERTSPITVGGVRSNIQRKISRLRQQIAIDRTKNGVSTRGLKIVSDLAEGKLDLKGANDIIAEEAKRRAEEKPKSRISSLNTTEDQERRQILVQIRTTLQEKAEQYPIKNVELTISQLQQLLELKKDDEKRTGEKLEAMRTVVINLIGGKRFALAKKVCEKFLAQDTKGQYLIHIKQLQEAIRNAEFGDFVLKGINEERTPEEDGGYFDLIEQRIKREQIKIAAIPLGKSKIGNKNITLADIWQDDKSIAR